jgi:hypothetical protein
MATSFEEFIQLELPKRPFLQTDVSTESIIVRRGVGARQLDGVALNDGDVLVKRNGVLVAESLSDNLVSAIDSVVHVQTTPAITWTITHTKNNRNVVITLLDSAYQEMLADSVVVSNSNIVFHFTEVQTGVANVVFLPA